MNWSTLSASINFSLYLLQFNYIQQVNHPTHIHGNILDVIITSSLDTACGINFTQDSNQAIKLLHTIAIYIRMYAYD